MNSTLILGIHHVAIIVGSEESILFYKCLGFKEFFRKERRCDTAVLLYGHGIQLEVFIDPRHSPKAGDGEEPLGLRHLAVRVDKIEDTVEELGLEIGPVMDDWTGVRFAFCQDPDGNSVELHE